MNVIQTFKPQPLRSARDLRELRMQLRAVSANLHADARAQFEFIGACTAVARSMLHRPGTSQVCLSILREDSHDGLRAIFCERLPETADRTAGDLAQSVLTGLPQHGLQDINRLVDQIDIAQKGSGHAVASLVKWLC